MPWMELSNRWELMDRPDREETLRAVHLPISLHLERLQSILADERVPAGKGGELLDYLSNQEAREAVKEQLKVRHG